MTPMQQDQQHQPKPPPPQAVAAAKPSMSPRANGAVLLGLGILVEGINVATLANDNTFYPKLVMIGGALIPLGMWTLATGIAYDKNNPVKPPTWWTAGAVLVSLAGLGLGIVATFTLS